MKTFLHLSKYAEKGSFVRNLCGNCIDSISVFSLLFSLFSNYFLLENISITLFKSLLFLERKNFFLFFAKKQSGLSISIEKNRQQ